MIPCGADSKGVAMVRLILVVAQCTLNAAACASVP